MASLGMVGLLVLAAPALRLHLGTADAGTDPSGTTTRQAYDLAVRGFGPGSVGPITIVAQRPSVGTHPPPHSRRPGRAGAGLRRSGNTRRHAVAAPQFSPSGTMRQLQVTPAWGPADRHTAALIGRISP